MIKDGDMDVYEFVKTYYPHGISSKIELIEKSKRKDDIDEAFDKAMKICKGKTLTQLDDIIEKTLRDLGADCPLDEDGFKDLDNRQKLLIALNWLHDEYFLMKSAKPPKGGRRKRKSVKRKGKIRRRTTIHRHQSAKVIGGNFLTAEQIRIRRIRRISFLYFFISLFEHVLDGYNDGRYNEVDIFLCLLFFIVYVSYEIAIQAFDDR